MQNYGWLSKTPAQGAADLATPISGDPCENGLGDWDWGVGLEIGD